LDVSVEHLLERLRSVVVGELMFDLHDDAFARIGLEKVDAHIADAGSEVEMHVVRVMVDDENVLGTSAPDVDVANAMV
jgi:hypothetical protein